MLAILEARQTLYDAISAAVDGLIPEDAQAFPGVAIKTTSKTRLEVVQVSARHPVRDLKGNIYTEEGVVQMFIVAEKGNGEAAAMSIAQTIANTITVGTRYNIDGGGLVHIRNHPSIRPGYADDTSWRIPVEIEYLATG